MDHGGPERSWSTTQHHGPAGALGPPLDHLDPAWTSSCNHTPGIAVQGGSRCTRGTMGTMELGGGPGALWSHIYILVMQIKDGWQRLNKNDTARQIVHSYERQHSIQMRLLNLESLRR